MIRRICLAVLVSAHALAGSAQAQPAPDAAAQSRTHGADAPFTEAEFREVIGQLSALEAGWGDLSQVETFARQLHGFIERDFGSGSRELLEIEFLIARVVLRQGRNDEALALSRHVAERAHNELSPEDELLWMALGLHIQARLKAGDPDGAQSFGSQVLLEAERRLGPEDALTASIRLELARATRYVGDADAAEAMLLGVVAATEGRDDLRSATLAAAASVELGQMRAAAGRQAEALESLDTALMAFAAVYRDLKRWDAQPDILAVNALKAKTLWAFDRKREAEAIAIRQMARVGEVYGRESTYWADFASIAALGAFDRGGEANEADAIALMQQVEAIRAEAYGAQNELLVEARDQLGYMLALTGRSAEAVAVFRRTLDGDAIPRGDYYLYALGRAASEGAMDGAEGGEATLQYLQAVQRGGAARAQAQLNSRLAAGSDEAAMALRALSDAEAEVSVLRGRLASELSKPLETRNAGAETAMRDALTVAQAGVRDLRSRIETDMPALAGVTGQASLSKADVQSRLEPDEALVIVESGALGGQPLALVLTRDDALWYSIGADVVEIEKAVGAIRSAVEMRLGVRAAASKQKGRGETGQFPAETAYWLHQALLGAAGDLLADKAHLYFDLRGPVTALPPHLLVASPPDGGKPDWLVRHHAITILPSLQALDTVGLARASQATRPVLAFADPVFDADGTIEVASLRGALAPLPETAMEAGAVVAAFGAGGDSARLGLNASEAALKAARLDDYRVLYFATHGLVAGDLAGTDRAPLPEPALALTPGDGEDGFLTASEIAHLHLSADWVVLSACNTAVGETPGAEPLSGLARAFMYAGARALMVSHWPVESQSAVHLMTDLFRRRAETPTMRAAEAQRQAILSMIDGAGRPEWAHPAYWAPFILVGVPGGG